MTQIGSDKRGDLIIRGIHCCSSYAEGKAVERLFCEWGKEYAQRKYPFTPRLRKQYGMSKEAVIGQCFFIFFKNCQNTFIHLNNSQ